MGRSRRQAVPMPSPSNTDLIEEMMAIHGPISDTSRGVQHEQDQSWPELVRIQLIWRDAENRPMIRTEVLSSDQFFGRNQYGAPLNGEFIIQAIERMRRAGPPIVKRNIRPEKMKKSGKP